jgi:hypothetical protein
MLCSTRPCALEQSAIAPRTRRCALCTFWPRAFEQSAITQRTHELYGARPHLFKPCVVELHTRKLFSPKLRTICSSWLCASGQSDIEPRTAELCGAERRIHEQSAIMQHLAEPLSVELRTLDRSATTLHAPEPSSFKLHSGRLRNVGQCVHEWHAAELHTLE